MERLRKQGFRNIEWLTIDGHEVVVAKDPHALITIAGYLKYMHAKEDGQGVYFRGQQKLYGNLIPTLYREIKTQGGRDKRELALKHLVDKVHKSAEIFKTFGDYAHEPLLQHYGITTTWIDLVDNVWVALWFACNRAFISGKSENHMHFEERSPYDKERYAYILLIATDIKHRDRTKPGYYVGDNTEFVDLRMAAPSVFLRPHAQHGCLFRQRGAAKTGRALDYSKHIYGTVAVELHAALDWLGRGKMVSSHALFPPPYYDGGYDILLNLDLQEAGAPGNILYVNP